MTVEEALKLTDVSREAIKRGVTPPPHEWALLPYAALRLAEEVRRLREQLRRLQTSAAASKSVQ